jgi:hypothetical protein
VESIPDEDKQRDEAVVGLAALCANDRMVKIEQSINGEKLE